MKAAFINSNLALVITYQTVQMVRVKLVMACVSMR